MILFKNNNLLARSVRYVRPSARRLFDVMQAKIYIIVILHVYVHFIICLHYHMSKFVI